MLLVRVAVSPRGCLYCLTDCLRRRARSAAVWPGIPHIVGELTLIDDEPRSATVVARTDCRLVAVDRRRFEYMVQETPLFGIAVMKVLADRLRKTSARIPSN
ncbi:MAG: Crp/Fnr family transcriptional regulator [Terriglobia bacterium]